MAAFSRGPRDTCRMEAKAESVLPTGTPRPTGGGEALTCVPPGPAPTLSVPGPTLRKRVQERSRVGPSRGHWGRGLGPPLPPPNRLTECRTRTRLRNEGAGSAECVPGRGPPAPKGLLPGLGARALPGVESCGTGCPPVQASEGVVLRAEGYVQRSWGTEGTTLTSAPTCSCRRRAGGGLWAEAGGAGRARPSHLVPHSGCGDQSGSCLFSSGRK